MKIQLKSLLYRQGPVFQTPDELYSFMSNFKYTEFSNLMSSKEVMITKQGSCHDQVIFEIKELSEMGLNPQAKFIMEVKDDEQGGETHSFVYYQDTNSPTMWYWFENAWEDYRGIHEFNDYLNMIDFIMQAFKLRHPYSAMYISDFIISEHATGEDLQTLVNICMSSAQKYSL